MDCIFCKIASGEIPAEKVYESEGALGLLDIHPLAPGHVFVIPKRHALDITELPDEDVASLFLAVKQLTTMLARTFSPDGFVIGINQGRFAGHTAGVDHVHVHVVPRWKNDGGTSIHGIVKNPPTEPLADIAEKIRAAC